MKKERYLIPIVLTILFLQCAREVDQLRGDWSILPDKDSVTYPWYLKLCITEDSITVLDEYQQEIRYPFHLESNTIQIANRKITCALDQSNYLSFDGALYAKSGDEYYEDPHLLKINLPEILGNSYLSDLDDYLAAVLYFGKSRSTSSWELQLNDVFASPADIPIWLSPCYGCQELIVVLAIDRHAPMENIDSLMQMLRLHNTRKVIFLSGDSIKHFGRTNKGLRVNLRPFFDFEALSTMPPRKNSFELDPSILAMKKYRSIRLVHNNLYLDSIPVKKDSLEYLLNTQIRSNPDFINFFIYENGVTYDQYITIMDKVYKVYHQIRNEASLINYGIPFDKLDATNKTAVANSNPIYFTDFSLEVWKKLKAMDQSN